MLPDLVQDVPREVGVARSGERWHLGFRSAVENAGRGPFRVVARRGSRAERAMVAAQLVSQSDGTVVRRPNVGRFVYVYHPDHQHWHLLGFERYELRSVEGVSRVRRDHKTGFCIADRYDVDFWSRAPFEPELPVFTRMCGRNSPNRLSVGEGLSVGYGDDYAAHLEGQYVDVTGLPAGRYELVHRVNPSGRIAEISTDNNASSALVRLSWPRGSRRAPRVRVLATCPGRAACRSVGATRLAGGERNLR